MGIIRQGWGVLSIIREGRSRELWHRCSRKAGRRVGDTLARGYLPAFVLLLFQKRPRIEENTNLGDPAIIDPGPVRHRDRLKSVDDQLEPCHGVVAIDEA